MGFSGVNIIILNAIYFRFIYYANAYFCPENEFNFFDFSNVCVGGL